MDTFFNLIFFGPLIVLFAFLIITKPNYILGFLGAIAAGAWVGGFIWWVNHLLDKILGFLGAIAAGAWVGGFIWWVNHLLDKIPGS